MRGRGFWEKVTKADGEGCWEIDGALNGAGYPSHGGMGAHRFAYLLYHGEIPFGLLVCHHCDNKRCIREDHLFAGTPSENALDCSRKGRANGPARAHHGEDHGRAKLTWDLVDEIRRLHPVLPGRGNHDGMLATAEALGVSGGLISQVVSRRIWKEEHRP